MPFKDFSYLELWWLLCSAERNHCAVLEQGIMRNISVKLFKFGTAVQEVSFKNISFLELWWAFCSSEWNHSCNINRGYHEE